jgi:hypothetical protein
MLRSIVSTIALAAAAGAQAQTSQQYQTQNNGSTYQSQYQVNGANGAGQGQGTGSNQAQADYNASASIRNAPAYPQGWSLQQSQSLDWLGLRPSRRPQRPAGTPRARDRRPSRPSSGGSCQRWPQHVRASTGGRG